MSSENHRFWPALLSFALFLVGSAGLTSDGILLLSFKYSILSDPLSVLQNWDYGDAMPCAWNGVVCAQIGSPEVLRVTGLVLPRSQLLGSISPALGLIEHLRHLDLSDNFFNGSLPDSIFNAAELQVLALGNNVISGDIPESIGGLKSLTVLNLSDNALSGKLPGNLSDLRNLTIVYLRSNYFSGVLPVGVGEVEELDLSSNLLNGSLPLDFGGVNLRYLNCSYNKISGSIPPQFAKYIPENAIIDLSFNNLVGAIPESATLLKQRTETFVGNEDLCGRPLKTICSIPSTLSTPPNTSTTSPAIAVIPKSIDSNEVPDGSSQSQKQSGGMNPATIAGIAIGDLAGIAVLALIILYVYLLRKKKSLNPTGPGPIITTTTTGRRLEAGSKRNPLTEPDTSAAAACSSCLTFHGEETSETTSSETDRDEGPNFNQKGGSLVALDGETELEPESLFTASAYVLGSSWSGIVYKAVLEDGTALAVRRIGAESAVGKVKDFESRVKAIAKIRHPNLVRVRGFYLGQDEKLIIHDYISNGSLAATNQRKVGSSPMYMALDVRLKIARGVARGLAYIHEKKLVHGNVKPSNILLKSDMEPMISDFGLDRLVSARQLGTHDLPTTRSSYVPEVRGVSPYRAPEALKSLKPNPKWDVYSFGLVLLELLTGRVFTEDELAQWGTSSITDERSRVLGLSDTSMISDVESREETMLTCYKLGFSCASLVPQKRPPMREVLQVLEKIQ